MQVDFLSDMSEEKLALLNAKNCGVQIDDADTERLTPYENFPSAKFSFTIQKAHEEPEG